MLLNDYGLYTIHLSARRTRSYVAYPRSRLATVSARSGLPGSAIARAPPHAGSRRAMRVVASPRANPRRANASDINAPAAKAS